jgi:hypothetical protein
LDSNFNNPPGEAAAASAENETKTLSPAEERFQSCRWRKAAENGTPDHCTHRDVLPMAGTAGFVPESWCPDCAYFKAKRSPRKRPESPPPNDNWRW